MEFIGFFFLQNICMYFCLVCGDVEIVRIFVKVGFDVNLQDMWQCLLLWYVVDLGNCEMVDMILEFLLVNIELYDMIYLCFLYVVVFYGNGKIVIYLFRKGVNFNVLYVFGNILFIMVCKVNFYEFVYQFFFYGVKVNMGSIYGVILFFKFLYNFLIL